MTPIYRQLLPLVACLALFGCSKQVPMGGKVSFPDGQPLTQGTVIFTTETFMAQGKINKSGRYDMGSYSAKDGLPPGEYDVYIRDAQEFVGMVGGSATTESDPGASGTATYKELIKPFSAKVEVKKGVRNYDITVEYP